MSGLYCACAVFKSRSVFHARAGLNARAVYRSKPRSKATAIQLARGMRDARAIVWIERVGAPATLLPEAR